MWRNLTYFVGLPAVALCMVNAYLMSAEEDHTPPEFAPYEHMRVRTKVLYREGDVVGMLSNFLETGTPKFCVVILITN